MRSPSPFVGRFVTRSAFVGALFALTACSAGPIALTHHPLRKPNTTFDDTLAVHRSARDLRHDQSRIGRPTLSLFAIPAGSVTAGQPFGNEVARLVVSALEWAGYDVEVVDPGDPAPRSSPTLAVAIEEFFFKNYTWLYPFIKTWGDIRLRVTLYDANQEVAFERTYSAEGESSCGDVECGFFEATTDALTDVLNQIVQGSSSREFRVAFEQPPAASPPEEVAAPPPVWEPAAPARAAGGQGGSIQRTGDGAARD